MIFIYTPKIILTKSLKQFEYSKKNKIFSKFIFNPYNNTNFHPESIAFKNSSLIT